MEGPRVSPSTLGSRMAAVRRAVGDSGDQQRFDVRPGTSGFPCFIGEVRERASRGGGQQWLKGGDAAGRLSLLQDERWHQFLAIKRRRRRSHLGQDATQTG
jgi:hypothetical protein